MDPRAKLVIAAAMALGSVGAHAQSYQVGQYLGNMNDAARFTYNTMGSAAQHANYGANGPAFTSAANGIRMAGTATATIGGRAVPLTLLSRIPTAAVATAARGLAFANPASAAVTLLGFAAMNGWLTPAGLQWNMDPATNVQHPFTREKFGPIPDSSVVWYWGGNNSYVSSPCNGGPIVASVSNEATKYCARPEDGQYNGLYSSRHIRCTDGSIVQWGLGAPRPTCAPLPVIEHEPVTWDQAQPQLEAAQPPDPNIVPELLKRGASFPQPVDQTLSGPSSQPGEKTTRQNADGSKTVTTTTHNYTYNQGNTAGNTSTNITNNTTTITTVTNISNEVVSEETETTENKPAEDVPGMCDLYPDVLACQKVKLNDVEPKAVPNENRTLAIQKDTGWGPSSGTCPAPRTATVMGVSLSMPFTMLCEFAVQIKPLLIGFAWLSAALTFFGFSRSKD